MGDRIEVGLDLAPDLAEIRVDPVQMEQVLLNLALNARDAMPKGGVIRFSASNSRHNGRCCELPHTLCRGGNTSALWTPRSSICIRTTPARRDAKASVRVYGKAANPARHAAIAALIARSSMVSPMYNGGSGGEDEVGHPKDLRNHFPGSGRPA
jgi:hypothetical protein